LEKIATFRGLPKALLEAFLQEMGGNPIDGEWEGRGWKARVESRRKVPVKAYLMEEVVVRISGEPGAVQKALKGLRTRAWQGRPPKD
jgi:hypothetical protein